MRLPDDPLNGTHHLTCTRPFRALAHPSGIRTEIVRCVAEGCCTPIGLTLQLDERERFVYGSCPDGHMWVELAIEPAHLRAYNRARHGLDDPEVDQEWLAAAGFGELPEAAAPKMKDIDPMAEIKTVMRMHLKLARREAKKAVRTHITRPAKKAVKRSAKRAVAHTKKAAVTAAKKATARPTAAVLRTAWQLQTAGAGEHGPTCPDQT